MKSRLTIGIFMIILGSVGLFLALPGDVCAQDGSVTQGQVLEGLHFSSAILGRNVNYAVYLPPDYSASSQRYPVVYLLHGYTDDESA